MTVSATAAFVLREAEAAGFTFASNGVEMVTRAPPGISRESLHTFERAIFDHRIEIMALIVDTYPACSPAVMAQHGDENGEEEKGSDD